MTEAALPASPLRGPWTGTAANSHSAARSKASTPSPFWHALARELTRGSRRRKGPPKGLLAARDPDLRRDAEQVSRCVPVQFGQLNEIYLRGHLILKRPDRMVLDELIAEGIRAASHGVTDTNELGTEDRAALDERVRYAADFLARREGHIARRRYTGGLLLGVVVSGFVLSAIYLASTAVIASWLGNSGEIPPEQIDAIRDVIVAVGGGAAGACVSVLFRLHREQNLTIEAAFSGAAQYRIYLGWFFAAAVVFLLKSGILEGVIDLPDPSAGQAARVESWFFWGAVGFLAGFNERWATNLITRRPGDSATGGSGASGEKTKTTDAAP